MIRSLADNCHSYLQVAFVCQSHATRRPLRSSEICYMSRSSPSTQGILLAALCGWWPVVRFGIAGCTFPSNTSKNGESDRLVNASPSSGINVISFPNLVLTLQEVLLASRWCAPAKKFQPMDPRLARASSMHPEYAQCCTLVPALRRSQPQFRSPHRLS